VTAHLFFFFLVGIKESPQFPTAPPFPLPTFFPDSQFNDRPPPDRLPLPFLHWTRFDGLIFVFSPFFPLYHNMVALLAYPLVLLGAPSTSTGLFSFCGLLSPVFSAGETEDYLPAPSIPPFQQSPTKAKA